VSDKIIEMFNPYEKCDKETMNKVQRKFLQKQQFDK
jgi:hypothetical protein